MAKKSKDTQPPALNQSSLRVRLNWATAARDRIAANALVNVTSVNKHRRLCAQIVRLRYLLGLQSGPAK